MHSFYSFYDEHGKECMCDMMEEQGNEPICDDFSCLFIVPILVRIVCNKAD